MEERLHLKGLNGLRGIAVISVVLSHLRIALPEFPVISRHSFDLASYAVTIFFTLSGFLITYLLCVEKKKKEISVKNFYIRRILRIWPLYFAYLFFAVLTIYINSPEKLPGTLPYYLFFAANIPSLFNSHLPYLGQYWSVAVEEQFYFFWPWIIKRSGMLLRSLIIFTSGFLLLKLIFRFIYFRSGNIMPLHVLAVTRFECMSIGGIAALLCLQQNILFLKLATNKFTQLIGWLSLPAMALNVFRVTPFLDNDLAALVTVVLIVNLSFNKDPLINLENRLFDFLGRISYGIYIMHPLVILFYASLLNKFTLTPTLKIILVYAGVLFFTIFIAWLSYEYFEKRLLKLKDRFSTVKSSDSKYFN